jgi:hypothetical protein
LIVGLRRSVEVETNIEKRGDPIAPTAIVFG